MENTHLQWTLLWLSVTEQANRCLAEEEPNSVLNIPFTRQELNLALSQTTNTAYNPEEDIHPLMLKKGGENLQNLLLSLSNAALKSNKFPSECKLDHKIPIPKLFRENYHVCKAYRPITLESIIGKVVQRMMRNRVEWFLESRNMYSKTQDAYRKDHNCNDLVLRAVQHIQEGWCRGETTVMCIFDFDSYFECIWREKLICKLHEVGIKGDMLRLIADYLTDRKFRIVVNQHTSDWVESLVGTPQGGILSTIITNVYSRDSDPADYELHGEFADDNIKLETDVCELKALQRLQSRIDTFLVWCKDHNISYTPDKIKLMVFRPNTSPRP